MPGVVETVSLIAGENGNAAYPSRQHVSQNVHEQVSAFVRQRVSQTRKVGPFVDRLSRGDAVSFIFLSES